MKTVLGILRGLVAALNSALFAVLTIVTLPFDRGGIVFHAIARGWAKTTLRICGITVSVQGIENIDRSQQYVYVSNHASLLDIPAIIAGIPEQIRVVYKKELEKVPIFGWGLKWGSYIGIDRSNRVEAAKSLERAAARIRRGASVLLYAEGTRTLDGKLQPFKRGAFNLAVRAAVPVVPLTVNGSYRILPKHSISIRPGRIQLVLERPITLEGRSGKDAELDLMRRVHDAIAEHYINQ